MYGFFILKKKDTCRMIYKFKMQASLLNVHSIHTMFAGPEPGTNKGWMFTNINIGSLVFFLFFLFLFFLNLHFKHYNKTVSLLDLKVS